MNLLFWKNNNRIDVFASALADELYSLIQPQLAKDYFDTPANDKKARKTNKKIGGKLQDIIKQVDQFRITHSLGIYGKARLHMKFTERLEELGYDANIAKRINELVMLSTP
jgi:hypothetical protein